MGRDGRRRRCWFELVQGDRHFCLLRGHECGHSCPPNGRDIPRSLQESGPTREAEYRRRSSFRNRQECLSPAGTAEQCNYAASFRPTKDPLISPTVSTKYLQLAELLKQKSLRRGNFTLASGKTSTYYIDGKLTCMDPAGAACIADAILSEIRDMEVDAVGGMDMGATPIIGAVAASSFRSGRPLPTFVVRKDVKAHGTMKLIEGPIPDAPCKVVIVDDVVTSGGSILKAIDAVEAKGVTVILAISILDRNAGASEALSQRGIPYHPLVTLPDIGINER